MWVCKNTSRNKKFKICFLSNEIFLNSFFSKQNSFFLTELFLSTELFFFNRTYHQKPPFWFKLRIIRFKMDECKKKPGSKSLIVPEAEGSWIVLVLEITIDFTIMKKLDRQRVKPVVQVICKKKSESSLKDFKLSSFWPNFICK